MRPARLYMFVLHVAVVAAAVWLAWRLVERLAAA